MAVHVVCSWPGSVAHGLRQRVEVSGFRLSRRASATQQKCRKIQAPKGLREMAAGRTANVNFLFVFTGQNGPHIQKPIVKSIIVGGGLPPRRAGRVAGRMPGAAQAGAGGRGSAALPRGGPRQDGQCQFSIGFYRSKWRYHSKTHRKITSFQDWGNPKHHACLPPLHHDRFAVPTPRVSLPSPSTFS